MLGALLAVALSASCYKADTIPNDGRFNAGAIAKPKDGYTDSLMVNAAGDRLYFTHSYLTPGDFIGVTSNSPHGEVFAGQVTDTNLEWNTDLYYIEWVPALGRWTEPINLGGSSTGANTINSLGNECCAWLNDDETEIIFYRDTFGLGALTPSGNYRATRPHRNAAWSTPVPLPGTYGTEGQTATQFRHDIQKTTSGDLYLWGHDTTLNESILFYGQSDGNGGWLPASIIPNMQQSVAYKLSTQPWVSNDERTLLFNVRDATGETSLYRSNRASKAAAWPAGSAMPLSGFADGAGKTIWGEPSFGRSENYALYIQFDTQPTGWKSNIMFLKTGPAGPLRSPVKLNQ